MNQQLSRKLVRLENKMQEKMIYAVSEQEKLVYDMLISLVKEIQYLLVQIEEMVADASYSGIVPNYQTQCEDIVEETLEILEEIMEVPFKVLIGKKLYEAIEDQMADLDDWIETINEALEGSPKILSYIEAWDIGAFLGE